ncbi:MAG TPA: ATP-binding protein, partial [Solirubrobacteraceae bacterium]|nr:ATP-binding protein [Solirubrobacteraceae bacterium]
QSFDRLPIRVRLASASALLTFVILCAFAIAIGSLTVSRIRADFNRQVLDTANELPLQLKIIASPTGLHKIEEISPALVAYGNSDNHTFIRLITEGGGVLRQQPENAPELEPSLLPRTERGYRVVTRIGRVLEGSQYGPVIGRVLIVYGRKTSDTEATVARLELFLILGVFAGTALALLAGMAIARRAMSPIAQLTSVAADIARTRDPSRRVPEPASTDEVSELAQTLSGMLHELDAARSERESVLARQRRFVADASHELRTPLTSVLANLELLAERSEVGGLSSDLGDAARSALRSSQRMRRLVADLLLLARTDVGRRPSRESVDLAQIVIEAAGELGPVSRAHEIVIDARPARVTAARDELHRLVINLIENALKHTPPGTQINVLTRTQGDDVTLIVEDDGPGVPAELVPTLFERFVRGAGDRGGSFGLGLAIVKAVADAHGGSVALDGTGADGRTGARFVVRLPGERTAPSGEDDAQAGDSAPGGWPISDRSLAT